MVQIMPAILAQTEDEFRRKVERVRPLGLMVQIDVMDGKFVENTTWAEPGKMREIMMDLPYEVHLMVVEPEHAAMIWLAAGASRVIYHAEATNRDDLILRSAGTQDGQIGIAINPETPLSRLTPVLDSVHTVLVMGVKPGHSGQAFHEIALDKVAAIKKLRPSIKVAVDGGVSVNNAGALAAAGADILVAATSLTDNPEPQLALAKLRAAADGELTARGQEKL
ncbi:MAG: hypothetical protein PHT12_04335 [Patescibacteria group bacterium]|nr:hypothetical protein [Patescibacteria group bacterium]